jgi:hypothetical protein
LLSANPFSHISYCAFVAPAVRCGGTVALENCSFREKATLVQLPALPLFLSLLEAIHANDLSSITLSPLFVPQTSLHVLSPSFQANRPFITASFSLSLKAQFGKDIFLAFCSFLFLILR